METFQIRVPAGESTLTGELNLPAAPSGLVILPHAGGIDVLGPTGHELQRLLHSLDYAVFTIDLLTPAEADKDRNTGWYHLDVPFLADRMCMLLAWIRRDPRVSELTLAIVAKGTTLAAALVSASQHAWDVQAVVSYHGRPDLAGEALPHVRSSVLLISDDGEPHLADLNLQAAGQLTAFHKLEVLPRESDAQEATTAAYRIIEWLEQQLAREVFLVDRGKGHARDCPAAWPVH